jgi:hypothetical protein
MLLPARLWRRRVGREEEDSAVSSAEENKAIVRRFEGELAKGNLDVIDEPLAPDFIDHALVAGQGPTREDFKRSSEEFLGVFTFTAYNIEEQIAEEARSYSGNS